jgi:hypothetical protein
MSSRSDQADRMALCTSPSELGWWTSPSWILFRCLRKSTINPYCLLSAHFPMGPCWSIPSRRPGNCTNPKLLSIPGTRFGGPATLYRLSPDTWTAKGRVSLLVPRFPTLRCSTLYPSTQLKEVWPTRIAWRPHSTTSSSPQFELRSCSLSGSSSRRCLWIRSSRKFECSRTRCLHPISCNSRSNDQN